MECGSFASAYTEANASALQTGQRAAPLSHCVGEGLGVRAEKLYPYQPQERGNARQGAPRCAPTPFSRFAGEGLGVRAKRREHLRNGGAPRCAPTPLSRFAGEGLGVRANTRSRS